MSEGQRIIRAFMLFAVAQLTVTLLAFMTGWGEPRFQSGWLAGAALGGLWGLWTGLDIARRPRHRIDVVAGPQGITLTESER